jgi:hypothetical protein
MIEVLVDATPGRGDDYIRLDPARDMGHMRTFAPRMAMYKYRTGDHPIGHTGAAEMPRQRVHSRGLKIFIAGVTALVQPARTLAKPRGQDR